MPVVLLMLVSGLLAVSDARAAETCWDERAGEALSVTGIVEEVDRFDGAWSIMTEIDIGKNCQIWEVFDVGPIPDGCQEGNRFTASGVIDASDDMQDNLSPEDNIVGLRASAISCK